MCRRTPSRKKLNKKHKRGHNGHPSTTAPYSTRVLPTVPEKEWLRGRCRLAPGWGGGGNESPWRPPVLLKKRGLARAILHNLAIASSMDPSFSLGSSKARVAVWK